MTMDDYVRAFIANNLGIQQHEIICWQFRAEEGGGYSEYTQWNFSCQIDVDAFREDGKEVKRHILLSEGETVAFLNGFVA